MHAPDAPLLSIIVPMYNVASTLHGCLASIEMQTYPQLEVLCIDDGSPDDSAAIAAAHASLDERISLIRKENGGYGSAVNRGLDEAHGSWIAIVEPDDWIEPTMAEHLLALASDVPEADVVRCAYWRIYPAAERRLRRVGCAYKGAYPTRTQSYTAGELQELFLHHPAIWAGIYRRSWMEEHAIRMREIPGAGWADNPFLIDTLCQANAIAYLDECCYNYRESSAEEARALICRDPCMPLDRWCDMQADLEELDVVDARILEAQAVRGVNYCALAQAAAPEDAAIRERIGDICRRIDPELVRTTHYLPRARKDFFFEMTGLPRVKYEPATDLAYHLWRAGAQLRANDGHMHGRLIDAEESALHLDY